MYTWFFAACWYATNGLRRLLAETRCFARSTACAVRVVYNGASNQTNQISESNYGPCQSRATFAIVNRGCWCRITTFLCSQRCNICPRLIFYVHPASFHFFAGDCCQRIVTIPMRQHNGLDKNFFLNFLKTKEVN